jgi:5-methylcytosine-specific restriction endonuclease McrA
MIINDPTLLCYYCGGPASTTDHVIPRSVLRCFDYEADPQAHAKLIKGRRLEVPACHECNTLLGSTYQETLQQRKAFLKSKLRKRYKKVLKLPTWTAEEIEELGPTLKKSLLASLAEKERLKRRLAW